MRTVCIIQARLDSQRFPRKVLHPLAGWPMLHHVWLRANAMKSVNSVVLAVPQEQLQEFLDSAAFGVYIGGPKDDVLARYLQIAELREADIVVRLTGDCPLIDPAVCDACVETLKAQLRLGVCYVATTRASDVTWPDGLDCEAFTVDALKFADAQTRNNGKMDLRSWTYLCREHVTSYIYDHDLQHGCRTLPVPGSLETSRHSATPKLSVDYPYEALIVGEILRRAGDDYSWQTTIRIAKELGL